MDEELTETTSHKLRYNRTQYSGHSPDYLLNTDGLCFHQFRFWIYTFYFLMY